MSINRSREQLNVPEKTVIFSFDDGPNGAVTTELLDVLQKYDITAIFFLLGENAEADSETVRRIRRDGHVIANHGGDGVLAVYLSGNRFAENLREGERRILQALGEEGRSLRYYRPHGGFYTNAQRRICQEQGYTILGVSARAYDAALSVSRRDLVQRHTIEKVEKEKGGIILLHDARNSYRQMEKGLARNPLGRYNRSWIPGTVEDLILRLEGQGYRLRNIDVSRILVEL
jgi:endo-1,4-beta-xylanase